MIRDVIPYNFVYNINEHDTQVSYYRWYDKLGSESDMKIVHPISENKEA